MTNETLILVYDRECPACRNYAQVVRIRESVGELKLIDARSDAEAVQELTAAGFDLDEGMALIVGERTYYGADTVHMLAILGSNHGFLNRINYIIFRSQTLSKILYPAMKAGRKLLLKLLGKTKINNLNVDGNDRY